jgi:F420-0:gamma-glutamyl ligase-like protein
LRLKAIRVRTRFWRPGTDFITEIANAIGPLIMDGDVVTISEKALSTATGFIVDESKIAPGAMAVFIAGFWARKIWGGPLGCLTKLRQKTLERLRNYPLGEGAAHKQLALGQTGLLQSLRHYSEGGIDASNLPYTYVSLPLSNPQLLAESIREALTETCTDISVMIVDGDTTYTWRNLHLAPRRVETPGLVHLGGFIIFVAGRALGLKARSTPIALSGPHANPDLALTQANIAHRVRGFGAGRTVWDMAEQFGTGFTDITWENLDSVKHYPIVIIREI